MSEYKCPKCGVLSTTTVFCGICNEAMTPSPDKGAGREQVRLPDLPKPLRSSRHWDEGIEWAIAGERAARLEREDQLRAAISDLARAEARVLRFQRERDYLLRVCSLTDEQKAELVRISEDHEDFWQMTRYCTVDRNEITEFAAKRVIEQLMDTRRDP